MYYLHTAVLIEYCTLGWASAPGFGRTPAPGTQKEAGALVEAVCPAR
jgi:hypothetical protein